MVDAQRYSGLILSPPKQMVVVASGQNVFCRFLNALFLIGLPLNFFDALFDSLFFSVLLVTRLFDLVGAGPLAVEPLTPWPGSALISLLCQSRLYHPKQPL